MDDTAVGVAIGLVALVAVHAFLNAGAARAAERQLRGSFEKSAHIRAVVHEEAPFGLLANNVRSLDVYADGIVSNKIPFDQTPRQGWKGSIERLRLHVSDSRINGLYVSKLDLELPHVTYDLGHALYKEIRILVRGSDEGRALPVVVGSKGLSEFARKRYAGLLKDVILSFSDDRVAVSGRLTTMGTNIPVSIEGALQIRDGRYIDIADATIIVAGKKVEPGQQGPVLKVVNPIVDVNLDLNLGGLLHVISVNGAAGNIEISGDFRLPMHSATVPEGQK